MKDYSNYYCSPNEVMLRDSRLSFQRQLRTNEGKDVIIDGIQCRALIYNHLNELNEFKEERVISCESDIKIHRGSYINLKGETYILMTDIDDHEVFLKGKMQKITDYLKYKANKKEYSIPAIITNQTLYTVGIEENKVTTLGDTKMSAIIGVIDGMEYIDRGMRFIFDNNKHKVCYEVTYVDGESRKGLLTCTLKEGKIKPEDDLTNDIAFNDYKNIKEDGEKIPEKETLLIQGNSNLYIKSTDQEYKVVNSNGTPVTDKTFIFSLDKSDKTSSSILDLSILASIQSFTDTSCVLTAGKNKAGYLKLKAACKENDSILLEKEIWVRYDM